MAAEVICVGTELLLGDILNSNSQYLAKELAALGVPHFYQTVVGDNIDRVHQAIEIGATRSSILIFTGGLGPTPDDLTTESIASYFNTPLVEHPEVIADIERKYAQRGREMTASNRKQSLQPQGAAILPNPLTHRAILKTGTNVVGRHRDFNIFSGCISCLVDKCFISRSCSWDSSRSGSASTGL